jgi:hypothetical protein
METEQPPTTFLSLPAELRNYIYSLSGCLKSSQRCDSTKYLRQQKIGNVTTHVYKDLSEACFFCSPRASSTQLSLSLWVNRNSSFAITGHKDGSSKKQGLRHNYAVHVSQMATATTHSGHIQNGVEQPELTKVSKQVRNDTLPIFYGSHSFLFTLFDREIDTASIFKWMRAIDKDNAALLREVKIVVRSKRDMKYAENKLKPALKKQGLDVDGRTDVKVVKLQYPFCYCEGCVRKALGER